MKLVGECVVHALIFRVNLRLESMQKSLYFVLLSMSQQLSLTLTNISFLHTVNSEIENIQLISC